MRDEKSPDASFWQRAHDAWRANVSSCRCVGECVCQYKFVCALCGDRICAIGEDMTAYEATCGQCASCFYFDEEGNPRA